MTNKFFEPAVNWLRADNKGYFEPYQNHWHFTATTPKQPVYRFATIVSTRAKDEEGIIPARVSGNKIHAGNWVITVNLASEGSASFTIRNTREDIELIYDGTTVIRENNNKVTLDDQLPSLEI